MVYKLLVVTLLSTVAISCRAQVEDKELQAFLQKSRSSFVFVEGGSFEMGHELARHASPVHQVTLDSYSIQKNEITFREFDIYTRINNLDSISPRWRDQKEMGPNYGAWGMDWQGARDYCQWLGKQLGLPVDLPTEAQWEYAARSRGLDVEHATNNGRIEGSLTVESNYSGTHEEIATSPPNPLGLYDMSGGRPEWVLDYLDIYEEKLNYNPIKDTILSSSNKVVRGFHTLTHSVYDRGSAKPENTGTGIGLRCVCNQKTPVE